jgi:diguanylate cyclase (GGDEF)-like protein/PAS domain S-box-containing protein
LVSRLIPFWRGTARSGPPDTGGLSIDPRGLLAHFPGPALIADARGKVYAANLEAETIAKALDAGALSELSARIPLVAADRRPAVERATLPRNAQPGELAYEFALLPAEEAGREISVLILARDTTMERNLTAALIDSRQRFKDLIDCSSDFSWETDRNGRFAFVTVRGALGYPAAKLDGRPAAELFARPLAPGSVNPFEARVAVADIELWLNRADGQAACLLVSAVPVIDRQGGEWLGARGVCRDVTEEREREAELEAARRRERLLADVVDAVRNEADPRRALAVAVRETRLALEAAHCWVFRVGKLVDFVLEEQSGEAPERGEEAMATVRFVGASGGGATIGEDALHATTTAYGGRTNGALCLLRARAWTRDDRALVDGLSAQIAVALQQIDNLKILKKASRRDPLTDLLNRRAFFDQVGRRLAHDRRTGRQGALVYVDLDNFKPVNDVHGHQKGDEALKSVARLLASGTRAGDLAARLGGDEFALWLEETDEAGAVAKARTLLGQARELAPLSVGPDRPLGFSIGIAMTDPAKAESVEALTARADGAMYRVKRGGKGTFAIAEAAA